MGYPTTAPRREGLFANVFSGIDERFTHGSDEDGQKLPLAPVKPNDTGLNADDFRQLVEDFERGEVAEREAERRAAVEQRRQLMARLIDKHISDDEWRATMHRAREAAEHGEKKCLLLQFPSQLCSDGGRAINVMEPDWPATLRGDAAELYLRWERDLKPKGFHLLARVVNFPGGLPGDIGLFLVWGGG